MVSTDLAFVVAFVVKIDVFTSGYGIAMALERGSQGLFGKHKLTLLGS